MYKFIKECKEGYSISEEDIKKVEECWGIKFPSILKKFITITTERELIYASFM